MHLGKNISNYQVFKGNVTSIGQFKQEVESHVSTTIQLGGKLAYEYALMEPLLAVDGETLQSYFAIVPADQLPYETLYEDMVVTSL